MPPLFRHPDGFQRPYSEARIIDTFEGTIIGAANVAEFRFSNNEARNTLATLRSISDPERIWTYDVVVGQDYLEQIDSWIRIAKQRPRDQSYYYEWFQRGRHDHLFDCEKMQIIVTSMAGLVGSGPTPEETTTEE